MADTVRVMSTSGLVHTRRGIQKCRLCTTGVHRVMARVTDARLSLLRRRNRISTDSRILISFRSVLVRQPIHGANCLVVSSSGNLTKKCGDSVLGTAGSVLTISRTSGSRFIILSINKTITSSLEGDKVRITFRVESLGSRPDFARIDSVMIGTVRLCHSKIFSRLCIYCGRRIGTLVSRCQTRGVLPLASLSSRRTINCRISCLFRPGGRRVLRVLLPRCTRDLVCNTVVSTGSSRRTSHVATVGDTASGTAGVVGSVAVRCGQIERATVARRVARVINKTSTLRS